MLFVFQSSPWLRALEKWLFKFSIPTLLSIVLAVALVLRLSDLERRPMHSDEAVQAAKSGLLFDT